jgi:DinB superfamily
MNLLFIENIKKQLHTTFTEVENWFDKPDEVLFYQPKDNAWTVAQILEHIALTSHFLLIIIEKGVRKSLNKAKVENWETEFENYVFDENKLESIGISKSFQWIRPEHMEPKANGEQDLLAVKTTIKAQCQQCLGYLDQMPNGEGVLLKTTMSVNNLGKIDVYEYIYFLAQHAARHIMQMERVEKEVFYKKN